MSPSLDSFNAEPFLLLVFVLSAALAVGSLVLQVARSLTGNSLIGRGCLGVLGSLFLLWLTTDQSANLPMAQRIVHNLTALSSQVMWIIQHLSKLIIR